jgi:hypothetical protein
VNLACEADVEQVESTTGELQTVYTATPANAASGTGGTAHYAAAVGAVITWRTGGIRNNRRVRGRTFLVPLYNTVFAADGSLASTTITTLGTAAAALSSSSGSPDLGVWARPTAPGASDGEWHVVTSHSIPDMGAVLRSRRD